MPEIPLLIMVAIAVVSAIVIFRIVKSIVQAIILVSVVAIILVGIAGAFVVMDALDLKAKLPASDNLLLISNDDFTTIIAGMVMHGQKNATAAQSGGQATPVSAAELAKLNGQFSNDDYAAMLGGNYRLFIIKESSIGPIPDVGPSAAEDGEFALITDSIAKKATADPFFIMSEYKAGNVMVYPESALFKAVKVLPFSLVRKIFDNALNVAAGVPKKIVS